MNVHILLEIAALCRTDDDAEAMLSTLQKEFAEAGPLAHLQQTNPEAYMEGDAPYVRFELMRVISGHYVTTIRPEIRDGALSVVVVTDHMKDGLGIQSQRASKVEGFDEEVIDASHDQTIEELATRAKDLAIGDHRLLMERVGVAQDVAYEAAHAAWGNC